jgi:hypothetical protein
LHSLLVVNEKGLAQDQRNNILRANEADLEQELTRVGNEIVEIEQSLQRFTMDTTTVQDEESDQSRRELLQELEKQQLASTILRDTCEEALMRTVYQRTGQKIKGVKATNDGVALTGFINMPEQGANMNQDISDISADNRGFVIAGIANAIDIKDLRRL